MGFWISSFTMMAGGSLLLKVKRRRRVAAVAVVVALGLCVCAYYLFTQIFFVALPESRLDRAASR